MIGYIALGFVLGVVTMAALYCWVYAHADRVCDAIERTVVECDDGGRR